MSLFREKEQIQAEIVGAQKMFELVRNHPLMGDAMAEKVLMLQEELANLPNEIIEAKISILFSGKAVNGSIGIKSSFVSRAIKPFLEMIKTQAAIVKFGTVARRGPVRAYTNSDLFITALPMGSFGLELSHLDSHDLFQESEISRAMKDVIRFIDNVSMNDDQFEIAIENTPKRNLSNLKAFLKEVSTENSVIKMESGELGVIISEQRVIDAYTRVSETIKEDDQKEISGTWRGILLDSGRFQILDSTHKIISGTISENLLEEDLINLDKTYLNKPCKIILHIIKTKFKTKNENIYYELIDVQPL